MRNWHTVEITAGTYTWTALATDTLIEVYNQFQGIGHPNKGVLLDGLTIAWEQDDPDRPVNGQDKPWEADFSVLVPALVDVVDLNPGAPVCIKVWGREPGLTYPEPDWSAYPEPPLALFLGRVADMEAKPHKLGNIVSLSCVDYTADLLEVIIGEFAWVAEPAATRVDSIGLSVGIGGLGTTSGMPNPTVEALPAGSVNAYDFLGQVLSGVADRASWSLGKGAVVRSGYLVDVVNDTDPFTLVDVTSTARGLLSSPDALAPTLGTPWAGGLPGVLGGPTTAVDIVIDPDYSALVNMQAFDACKVKFDLDWQNRRGQSVEAVTITHDDVPVSTTWTDGPPPASSRAPVATYVQETQATAAAAWADLAAYLTPDRSETGWAVDTVTLVDLDPATDARRLLLMVISDGPGTSVLARSQSLSIFDLPPEHSPDGTTWYAGTPVACSITFSKGAWQMDVSLARRLSRSDTGIAPAIGIAPAAADGYVSCDNLRTDPTYSATRYVDVVPTVTYYDMRIVRSHDA